MPFFGRFIKFKVGQILYITFFVAMDPHNKVGHSQNSSKPKTLLISSKISILHSALNFEVGQIMYITFLISNDAFKKKKKYQAKFIFTRKQRRYKAPKLLIHNSLCFAYLVTPYNLTSGLQEATK